MYNFFSASGRARIMIGMLIHSYLIIIFLDFSKGKKLPPSNFLQIANSTLPIGCPWGQYMSKFLLVQGLYSWKNIQFFLTHGHTDLLQIALLATVTHITNCFWDHNWSLVKMLWAIFYLNNLIQSQYCTSWHVENEDLIWLIFFK